MGKNRFWFKVSVVFAAAGLCTLLCYVLLYNPANFKIQDESRLDAKTSYAYAGRVVDQLLVSENKYYTHITGTLTEIICIKTTEKETIEKNLERNGSWSFDNRDLFLNCDVGDDVYILIGDSGIRMIDNRTTGWNVYYFKPATEE